MVISAVPKTQLTLSLSSSNLLISGHSAKAYSLAPLAQPGHATFSLLFYITVSFSPASHLPAPHELHQGHHELIRLVSPIMVLVDHLLCRHKHPFLHHFLTES